MARQRSHAANLEWFYFSDRSTRRMRRAIAGLGFEPAVKRETDAVCWPLTRRPSLHRVGSRLLDRGPFVPHYAGLVDSAGRPLPVRGLGATETLPPTHARGGLRSERLARAVYLGPLIRHYGHFILETLARLWVLADSRWHRELEDRVLLFHAVGDLAGLESSQLACLSALGLSLDRVRIIDSIIEVDDLLVAEPALRIRRNISRKYLDVCRKIADVALGRLAASGAVDSAPAEDAGPGVYLSRTRFPHRPAIGEGALEQLFRDNGFEVVYPERERFSSLVAKLNRARVVAGLSGSALHNLVFCTRPRTVLHITRRNDRCNENFLIVDRMMDHRVSYINGGSSWGLPRGSLAAPYLLDVRRVSRHLQEHLGFSVAKEARWSAARRGFRYLRACLPFAGRRPGEREAA